MEKHAPRGNIMRSNFWGISVILCLLSSASSYAVVAKQYLPDSAAPASVCFISFWNNFADQFTHPAAGCSGTLIRSNRVLTAAHCLDNFETTQGATIVCNNGKSTFSVDGYVADPDYRKAPSPYQLGNHDVAIIGLDGHAPSSIRRCNSHRASIK